MELKLSHLENKSEKRLKALNKKYWGKIRRLESIVINARDFNIPLNNISVNAINDKITFYLKEIFKITNIRNVKFNPDFKGRLLFK
jgi:hypothetical protein